MKEAHIIKKILKIAMIILFLFTIIAIYNLGYKTLYKTDFAYLFGYTSFKVNQSNYSPEIKSNNVIVLKKNSNYSENDIVVFYDKGDYKIANILDSENRIYKAVDKLENEYYIDSDNIIGKYIINLLYIGTIYKIFTSPLIFIFLGILVGIYFFVSLKEKSS